MCIRFRLAVDFVNKRLTHSITMEVTTNADHDSVRIRSLKCKEHGAMNMKRTCKCCAGCWDCVAKYLEALSKHYTLSAAARVYQYASVGDSIQEKLAETAMRSRRFLMDDMPAYCKKEFLKLQGMQCAELGPHLRTRYNGYRDSHLTAVGQLHQCYVLSTLLNRQAVRSCNQLERAMVDAMQHQLVAQSVSVREIRLACSVASGPISMSKVAMGVLEGFDLAGHEAAAVDDDGESSFSFRGKLRNAPEIVKSRLKSVALVFAANYANKQSKTSSGFYGSLLNPVGQALQSRFHPVMLPTRTLTGFELLCLPYEMRWLQNPRYLAPS